MIIDINLLMFHNLEKDIAVNLEFTMFDSYVVSTWWSPKCGHVHKV